MNLSGMPLYKEIFNEYLLDRTTCLSSAHSMMQLLCPSGSKTGGRSLIAGGGQRFPDYFLKVAGKNGAHMTFKKPVGAKEMLGAVTKMIGEGN